ncbi:hypothetical protein BpHYR1_022417 [Brachionus plicatilis]|uniref:Uncharacterized protein n=1 Tax=Brachionus plicatilis TaxID=10195 RepID=A0A3M7QCF1_BRAPC|nr:hypothetical protein BpHYR1_022417 [Brachionus plicatilis]
MIVNSNYVKKVQQRRIFVQFVFEIRNTRNYAILDFAKNGSHEIIKIWGLCLTSANLGYSFIFQLKFFDHNKNSYRIPLHSNACIKTLNSGLGPCISLDQPHFPHKKLNFKKSLKLSFKFRFPAALKV